MSGNLMWHTTYYYDPGYKQDYATCFVLDTSRNVYVAGVSHTLAAGNIDNSLLKINPNGVIQWASVYKGIGGNNQCGNIVPAMAVTPDGSAIYYTTFCGNGTGGGGYDIVTLKYNSLGDSDWVRRYGGGVGGTQNAPAALKLDRYFNIYVTGDVYNSTSGDDYATIKYLPIGTQQWVATYNGPLTNSIDAANDLIIDTSLNVYVTGFSSRQNIPVVLVDATTIKYNQPNGIQQVSNNIPKAFKLGSNYPNPFNPNTMFKFEIPKTELIKIVIYDILGREVAILMNEKLNPGVYEANWNAGNYSSGVYFYQLIADGQIIDTKKMILLK